MTCVYVCVYVVCNVYVYIRYIYDFRKNGYVCVYIYIYIYVCVCVFSICTYHLYVCAHLGTRVRTRVRDAVSQG